MHCMQWWIKLILLWCHYTSVLEACSFSLSIYFPFSLSLSFFTLPCLSFSLSLPVFNQFLHSWLHLWEVKQAALSLSSFRFLSQFFPFSPPPFQFIINWHLIQWQNKEPQNSSKSCASPQSLWVSKWVQAGGTHSTWSSTAVTCTHLQPGISSTLENSNTTQGWYTNCRVQRRIIRLIFNILQYCKLDIMSVCTTDI